MSFIESGHNDLEPKTPLVRIDIPLQPMRVYRDLLGNPDTYAPQHKVSTFQLLENETVMLSDYSTADTSEGDCFEFWLSTYENRDSIAGFAAQLAGHFNLAITKERNLQGIPSYLYPQNKNSSLAFGTLSIPNDHIDAFIMSCIDQGYIGEGILFEAIQDQRANYGQNNFEIIGMEIADSGVVRRFPIAIFLPMRESEPTQDAEKLYNEIIVGFFPMHEQLFDPKILALLKQIFLQYTTTGLPKV